MNVQRASWITENRTGRLGRISHDAVTTRGVKGRTSTHHDLPRASSLINENYCMAGSSSVSKQTMNFVKLNVNCHVANHVHTAPGLSQKKELSPGLAGCFLKENKLKYVKSAYCVTQVSCVKPVTNVKNVASNLPVGARLQNFWQTWLDLGAGPYTYTGPLAECPGQNTINTVITGLSGPAVHVPDRFANSHRKAGSPRPTAHETHTVASQIQLEGTRITRKGDPNSQVPAPPLTMVAKRRPWSHRPTITPNKTCSANIYRCIKRRVGRSLK